MLVYSVSNALWWRRSRASEPQHEVSRSRCPCTSAALCSSLATPTRRRRSCLRSVAGPRRKACLWLRASRWAVQASASLDQPRAALTGLCFRHTGGGHWCKQLNGWIFPEAKREQVVAAMGDDVTEEQVVHAPKPSVNANATLLVSRHKKAHLRRVDQATPEPEPEPEREYHPHPTRTPSPTPPPRPHQATLVTGETLKVRTQGQSGLSRAGPELRPRASRASSERAWPRWAQHAQEPGPSGWAPRPPRPHGLLA